MVMEAGAEGAKVAETVTGDASASKNLGLSPGQKLGAAGAGLPRPRTHHPYIVGLALMTVGAFALVGSITGALPSMLAALFCPNALVDTTGNSVVGDILHDIGHAAITILPEAAA